MRGVVVNGDAVVVPAAVATVADSARAAAVEVDVAILRPQDLLLSLVAMALATPVTHNIAVIATTFAARVTAIEAAAVRDAAVRVDDMQAAVATIQRWYI